MFEAETSSTPKIETLFGYQIGLILERKFATLRNNRYLAQLLSIIPIQ